MPPPLQAREAGIVRTSRTRALIPALGAAGAVGIATTVLHRSGGHGLGPLGSCWFHGLTGLQCPFCGSLRGVAALSYGDPLTALHDNAPVMLLLVAATLVWGRRLLYAATGRVVDQPRVGRGTYVALGLFFLAFTIYRNLPAGSWLAPLS